VFIFKGNNYTNQFFAAIFSRINNCQTRVAYTIMKIIKESSYVLLIFVCIMCEGGNHPTVSCKQQKVENTPLEEKHSKSPYHLTRNIKSECAAVMTAAKVDFPGFLEAAWPQKTDFGFHKDDTMESVALVTPICVYGIDEEVSKLVRDGKSLATVVQPVGEWIFPVMAGKAYRTIFGVRLVGGKWKGVYFGNPYLAKSFGGLRKVWGNGFRLLSSTDPRGFFFIVPENKKPNLTPMTRVVLNNGKILVPELDWHSLQKAQDVLDALDSYWSSKALMLTNEANDFGFSMEVEGNPTPNAMEGSPQ